MNCLDNLDFGVCMSVNNKMPLLNSFTLHVKMASYFNAQTIVCPHEFHLMLITLNRGSNCYQMKIIMLIKSHSRKIFPRLELPFQKMWKHKKRIIYIYVEIYFKRNWSIWRPKINTIMINLMRQIKHLSIYFIPKRKSFITKMSSR